MNDKLKDLLSRFTSRSTLFCTAFSLGGFIALWKDKIHSADFPIFAAVVLSAVVGHSVSCSYFEGKNGKDENHDHDYDHAGSAKVDPPPK